MAVCTQRSHARARARARSLSTQRTARAALQLRRGEHCRGGTAHAPSVSGATHSNVTSKRKPVVKMQGLSKTVILVTFTAAISRAGSVFCSLAEVGN